MDKTNLDKIMREYYYERNSTEDTIAFLYTMADLYRQLIEPVPIHTELAPEPEEIMQNNKTTKVYQKWLNQVKKGN